MTRLIRAMLPLLLVCLAGCGDDSGPAGPQARVFTEEELEGSWRGELTWLRVSPGVPLTRPERVLKNVPCTIEFLLPGETNLNPRLYSLRLDYDTDTLDFHYSEEGRWDLDGEEPGGVLFSADSGVFDEHIQLGPGVTYYSSGSINISGYWRGELEYAEQSLTVRGMDWTMQCGEMILSRMY